MAFLDLYSRTRAALIHFSGSATVAATAAALVFLLWYPYPYSLLAGGRGLFVLITTVDVVMGPLLTFAVFNRRKPASELRRDLAIIVLLQLAALSYGMHTMFIARPVVFALEGDRFRVVAEADVLMNEMPLAPPALRELSLTGPVMVRTVDPSAEDKFEAIGKALAGNDLGTRPKYWRPWDDVARQEVRSGAKQLAELRAQYPAHIAEIDAAVAKTKLPSERVKFLPIISRHLDAVMLVDTQSGELVGFVPLDRYYN